jgi:hypothetical protein
MHCSWGPQLGCYVRDQQRNKRVAKSEGTELLATLAQKMESNPATKPATDRIRLSLLAQHLQTILFLGGNKKSSSILPVLSSPLSPSEHSTQSLSKAVHKMRMCCLGRLGTFSKQLNTYVQRCAQGKTGFQRPVRPTSPARRRESLLRGNSKFSMAARHMQVSEMSSPSSCDCRCSHDLPVRCENGKNSSPMIDGRGF